MSTGGLGDGEGGGWLGDGGGSGGGEGGGDGGEGGRWHQMDARSEQSPRIHVPLTEVIQVHGGLGRWEYKASPQAIAAVSVSAPVNG